MTYRQALSDPVGVSVLGVHFEGISTLPVSRTPRDLRGSAWTAPTDGLGNSYTVSETLLSYDGIGDVDSEWSPKGGIAEGGAFEIRLALTSAIRTLFATELTTMLKARLAQNVGYNVAGATNRYAFPLVAGSGGASFPASGVAYCGLETFYYGAKADANTLGDATAGNMDRGAYCWRSDSKLDREHKCDLLTYRQPVYVTDHPTEWEGRRVTVLQWLGPPMGIDPSSSQQPLMYDTGYKGTHEIEIRSGYITDVQPGDGEIIIRCTDLTSAVKGEIGHDACQGRLWYKGLPEWVYVDDSGLKFRCHAAPRTAAGTVIQTPNSHDDFLVTTDGTSGGTLLTGWRQLGALAQYIALSIETQANVINADSVDVRGFIKRETNEADGTIRRWLELKVYDGGAVNQVYGQFQVWPVPGTQASDLFGTQGNGWNIPGGLVGTPYNTAEATEGDVFQDPLTFTSREVTGKSMLRATATDMVCTADYLDGGTTQGTIPSSGTALIRDGDRAEWISYTSTSTTGLPPGATRLIGCTRGAMGTAALEYVGADGVDPPSISFQGVLSGTLADIVNGVLVSTGAAAHGTYDTLTADLGLKLDPAAVDSATIAAVLSGYERRIPVSEPIDLEELIEDSAVLHGFALMACTDRGGRYRLTAVNITPSLKHDDEFSFSLATGTMLDDPLPEMQQSGGKPIKRIQAQLRCDPVTGEASGPMVYVDDAQQHDPAAVTLKIKIPGFVGDAAATMLAAGERLFATWGRRYWVHTSATDRQGLLALPGRTVTLTAAGGYNPDGTTGLSAVKAVVLRRQSRPWAPGTSPPAELTCGLFGEWYGIAPTFQLSAYNAVNKTCSISDNVFTYSAQPIPSVWETYGDGYSLTACKDWHHGPAPTEVFKMYFYVRGNYADGEALTATGTGAGTWLLSAAFSTVSLTGVDPTVTTVYACFQPWGTADNNGRQELYAHISDDSYGLGPDPDTGHLWSP